MADLFDKFSVGLEADPAEQSVVQGNAEAAGIGPVPAPAPAPVSLIETPEPAPTPVNEAPPIQQAAEPIEGQDLFDKFSLPASSSQGQGVGDRQTLQDEAIASAKARIPQYFETAVDSVTGALTPIPPQEIQGVIMDSVEALYKSVGHTLSTARGAAETGAHAVQIPIDFLSQSGVMDEDTANNFRKATRSELNALNTDIIKMFGDGPQMHVAENVGKYGVAMVWPASFLRTPIGAGMFRAFQDIGMGTAAGALGAATTADISSDLDEELQTRLAAYVDPAKEGALFGGAIGVVAAVLNKFKWFATSGIANDMDSPITRRGFEIDDWMTQRFSELGVKSRVASVVDNPWIGDSTRSSFGTMHNALDPLARRGVGEGLGVQQIYDNIWMDSVAASTSTRTEIAQLYKNLMFSQRAGMVKVLDDTVQTIGRADGFGARVQAAVNEGVETLSKARKENAEKNFGLIRKVVSDEFYETAEVIGLKHTREVIESEIKRASMTNLMSESARKKLKGIAETEIPGTKHMTLDELQKQLSRWSKAALSGSDEWKELMSPKESSRISKRVYGALMDDADAAVQANIPGADLLRKAREDYKIDSDALRAVEETALAKFFEGGKGGVLNGENLERTITALATSNKQKLRESMDFVEKYSPGLKEDIKAFWLQRFLTKATHKKDIQVDFSDSSLDPERFLDIVTGDNLRTFEAIFTGSERETVSMAVDAVRRINKTLAMGGPSLMPQIKGLSGVAMSADPTFAARLAAEVLTPKYFSKYATSKEALKALTILAEPYNTAKWGWAVGVLSELSGIIPNTPKQDSLEEVPQGGISQ